MGILGTLAKVAVVGVVPYIVGSVLFDEEEGRKEGASQAAKLYKPIIKELKHACASLKKDIEEKRISETNKSTSLFELKTQLEKRRDHLKMKVESIYSSQTSASAGHGIGGAQAFNGIIGDFRRGGPFILDDFWEKWQVEAIKAGFEEAKEIFEEKISRLKAKLNRLKEQAASQIKQFIDLQNDILSEIESLQNEIVKFQILLG